MTERETLLLNDFKEKLDKLIRYTLKMKSENRLLLEEQARLKEQISLLNTKNEELQRKIEELKFAKSMLGGEENSHEAKIKINRLVREIDKCIALLNK
jgi:phage shock protein A